MKFRTIISFVLASSWVLIAASSCSESEIRRATGPGIGHGPPAHARAHGYRRKQVAGVELVFDSGIGVYVVVGHPNHYYHDGHFYRLSGVQWEISLQPDDGWAFVAEESLPPGLQKNKNKHTRASWSESKKPPHGRLK
ncbi:MAG: hypothetical protein ABIF19_02330 [Planctomycetota bacterium]